MPLRYRKADCSIPTFHHVTRETVSDVDVEAVSRNAIGLASTWKTVPGRSAETPERPEPSSTPTETRQPLNPSPEFGLAVLDGLGEGSLLDRRSSRSGLGCWGSLASPYRLERVDDPTPETFFRFFLIRRLPTNTPHARSQRVLSIDYPHPRSILSQAFELHG